MLASTRASIAAMMPEKVGNGSVQMDVFMVVVVTLPRYGCIRKILTLYFPPTWPPIVQMMAVLPGHLLRERLVEMITTDFGSIHYSLRSCSLLPIRERLFL